MTPHKQLIMHRPSEGQWGDCGRTAIACLLDVEPASVPHWYDNDPDHIAANEAENAWLREHHGLTTFTVGYATDDLGFVLGEMGRLYRDAHYLLIGASDTGCGHVVICKGDKIVHDPHPANVGVVGPHPEDGMFHITVLTKVL